MSKTKKVTITITKDQQEYVRSSSVKMFGRERGNISGYISFLIEKDRVSKIKFRV